MDVVRRVHNFLPDIIVVVDGCTDNTLELLSSLEFSTTVVSFPKNKGKGRALVAGFRKAIELGYDFALTIDADGQHYPEDIPVLLRAHDVHPNALIVGSRQFTDDNMPGKSKFANRFSNFWFALQTTIHLPDTQTGMRLYPLHRLHGLSILTSRYEAELELLVFAAWHNVPLVPVPIRVYYPPKEQRVSHFNPMRDFTRISILNCFLCIGALLFGYINMYWRTVLCFLYFGVVMLLFVHPYTWLFTLIHGHNAESRKKYHRFVWRMCKHFVRMISGLNLTIDENFMVMDLEDEQRILISNHQSYIDVIVYLSLSPNITMVVKDYIWNNPILGIVVRNLDCVSTSFDEDRREATVKRIIEEGYYLLIFPEGTRSETGEIGHFQSGAFYYSAKYDLSIQPFLIEGMTDYLGKKQFAIKPADVCVTVLPCTYPKEYLWGATFRKRAKSYELHYHALLHSKRRRVGVIGGGVGGLFTGALLAQKGYEVIILEATSVCGGGLYSYQRDGETWQTGMHILSGMEEGGPVRQVLGSLGIEPQVVPTTLDNSPAELIGDQEWEQCRNGVSRLVGGGQKLADDLATYIIRHGGEIMCHYWVRELTMHDNQIWSDDIFPYDIMVSTIHPKKLLEYTELPIYRPATCKRISSTPETKGSFKTYIRLKPDTLPYDEVTHYLPEHKLLVMTPCTKIGQKYARTIETVMPMDYSELSPWHTNREKDYAAYETFKHTKEQEVLDMISKVYPNIREQMISIFSSTSLTFRDIYLSPEGSMFGMTEGIGSVRTHLKGFYVSGQNVFLHGLCGVVMTAQQTVNAICEDYK